MRRTQAFGAGHHNHQLRLDDHAMQLERAAVRDEIGRIADQGSGDEVGVADMLGVAATLERHQIVETRLETRNDAACLCFGDKIARRGRIKPGDVRNIGERENLLAPLVELHDELGSARTQRLEIRCFAQFTPHGATFCAFDITEIIFPGNSVS